MEPSSNVGNSKPVAASKGNTGDDARAQARGALQLIRHQLRAYASIPQLEVDAAPVATKPAAALAPGDLPPQLQRLYEEYQQQHPEFHVQPVRHLSTSAPGGEVQSAFTTGDIPDEEDLVVLVLTETVVSAAQLEVRSHMLLARREKVG